MKDSPKSSYPALEIDQYKRSTSAPAMTQHKKGANMYLANNIEGSASNSDSSKCSIVTDRYGYVQT